MTAMPSAVRPSSAPISMTRTPAPSNGRISSMISGRGLWPMVIAATTPDSVYATGAGCSRICLEDIPENLLPHRALNVPEQVGVAHPRAQDQPRTGYGEDGHIHPLRDLGRSDGCPIAGSQRRDQVGKRCGALPVTIQRHVLVPERELVAAAPPPH